MQQALIQPLIIQFARIRRGSHLAIGAIRQCRCQKDTLARACRAWPHSGRARRGTALSLGRLKRVCAGLVASPGRSDSFGRQHPPLLRVDLPAD